MIRPVAQHLYDSIMLDEWPRASAIVDFGIDSQQHYEALYDPIRSGELTLEKLNEILGDGQKITDAVEACKSNRHKGIKFVTPWDELKDE